MKHTDEMTSEDYIEWQKSEADKARSLLAEAKPTPVKEDEPLAVLADRKGWFIQRIIHYPDRWVINLDLHKETDWPKEMFKPIVEATYALAEAAARAYLNTLPDTKGGK